MGQRLSRIHAGRAEELTISGNIELRVGTDWKLISHGRTGGSHVAGTKRDTSKLIKHGIHDDVLILRAGGRALQECRAFALGVMVGAILGLVVHV